MYRKRLRPVLGAAASPAPAAGAFFLCPLSCLPLGCREQWPWQQALYQWAFDQAREVIRPALPERDLLAVWN
jgi:hypothetical protein